MTKQGRRLFGGGSEDSVYGPLKSERNSERGFTLIEMMVASAIFAIAAAVAFILYSAAQDAARTRAAEISVTITTPMMRSASFMQALLFS